MNYNFSTVFKLNAKFELTPTLYLSFDTKVKKEQELE